MCECWLRECFLSNRTEFCDDKISQHAANHGTAAWTAKRDCPFVPRRISFVEMFLNRLAHGLKDFHPSTTR